MNAFTMARARRIVTRLADTREALRSLSRRAEATLFLIVAISAFALGDIVVTITAASVGSAI